MKKKAILSGGLTILFITAITSLGYSQMTKEATEFELLKYTKNTCYRFSIASLNSLKSIDIMVDDKFEIKFAETVLTITNGDKYFALPYTSINLIESSTEASKKEGKFTIYIK
jgi:hypothetical protein